MALDADALKELFEPFGAVVVKRMFGGHGIYAEGLCFAIQAEGEVYLKCDSDSEAQYLAVGSKPFVYTMKGKPMAMAYWRLPSAAYDDAEELRRWAELGLIAARRAAAAKAAKAKAPARRASPRPKSGARRAKSPSRS